MTKREMFWARSAMCGWIDNLRASDVDLSGGVLADLAFGRRRVSVEHLKDMLVELEGEE